MASVALGLADGAKLGAFLADVEARVGSTGLLAIGHLFSVVGLGGPGNEARDADVADVTFHYRTIAEAPSTVLDGTTAFPPPLPGSDYQPAPGIPAPPSPELRTLHVLAIEADMNVPVSFTTPFGDIPIPGWLRGILVHVEFAKLVRARFGWDHAEVSYRNGLRTNYGAPGSVRADAIVGSPDSPTIVVDLKTGGAYLTTAQIRDYYRNLPAGAIVIEIRTPP